VEAVPDWLYLEETFVDKVTGQRVKRRDLTPNPGVQLTTAAGDQTTITVRPAWTGLPAGGTTGQIIIRESDLVHRLVITVTVVSDGKAITLEVTEHP
jgi:hypothetical protein